MIEICFESDQKVRPLLRPDITFRGLCHSERFISIFRKGGRVQSKGRACHDELGECLLEVSGCGSSPSLYRRRFMAYVRSAVSNW